MDFNKNKPLKIIILGMILFSFTASLAQSSEDSVGNLTESNASELFVFVGKKIKVKKFPIPPVLNPDGEGVIVSLDSGFNAKYQIIEKVHGDYPDKFIEFKAYDHYGYPNFANFKYSLLFVSLKQDGIYHVRDTFFDVYKTKNGKWATCGDPYKFDLGYRKNIKATKLEFDKPLIFNIKSNCLQMIENM